jgi:succinate dehydrogenase / fumarate reductase flavoprotein subunit
MQGLADGYFCIIYNGDYLAQILKRVKSQQTYLNLKEENVKRVLNVLSQIMVHSVDYFHKKLGKIMWNKVGMAVMQKD